VPKMKLSVELPPIRFSMPVNEFTEPAILPAFEPITFQVLEMLGPVNVSTPLPPFRFNEVTPEYGIGAPGVIVRFVGLTVHVRAVEPRSSKVSVGALKLPAPVAENVLALRSFSPVAKVIGCVTVRLLPAAGCMIRVGVEMRSTSASLI